MSPNEASDYSKYRAMMAYSKHEFRRQYTSDSMFCRGCGFVAAPSHRMQLEELADICPAYREAKP